MWTFYIEEFYHVLQGVLCFQLIFFCFIFYITKRKEVKYYCFYLLFTMLYYFINGPKTFFNIEDDLVFNSDIYVKVNYFLLISSMYFYVVFLEKLFATIHHSLFNSFVKATKIGVLILVFLFYLLPYLNVSRSLIFYFSHLITLPFASYAIYLISSKKGQYHSFIQLGIFFNLMGYVISLLMILRYNTGVRIYPLDDYPLIWMRIGTLIDIFFFQLALLWRWYDQEKTLATKDLQSQIEVERLRNDISQEIHDDIGTTLSKINLSSFVASKKLKTGEPFNVEATFLSIQKASQEMVTNLKEIVWSIERDNKFYNEVFSKIEEYTHTMCATKEIKTTISFLHDHSINLTINTKYHLYLICKEAVNNAVKYSNAKNVMVSTVTENNSIKLTIKDDGNGFDLNASQNGLGLKSMKNRASKIKAQISIQSGAGRGTEISIMIPTIFQKI